MPTLNEVAPQLSQLINQTQAEDIAVPSTGEAAQAPTVTDITTLGAKKKKALLLWLKWYRAKSIAHAVAEVQGVLNLANPPSTKQVVDFLRMSPRQLCARLNLSMITLESLLVELAAIRAEVARGEDAWMPAAITPTITSVTLDSPIAGDLTIDGTDFDSWAPKVTTIRITRFGVGSVTLTQAQIAAAGGAVTSSQIVVPGGLLPGAGANTGDQLVVRADGLDSAVFVIG